MCESWIAKGYISYSIPVDIEGSRIKVENIIQLAVDDNNFFEIATFHSLRTGNLD